LTFCEPQAVEISDQELDRLIMSLTPASWQKVAMILAKSLGRLESDRMRVSAERLAARIEFLVPAGRLEAQGNLSRWRYSEIRLPAQGR
jgi:hypothetical protein